MKIIRAGYTNFLNMFKTFILTCQSYMHEKNSVRIDCNCLWAKLYVPPTLALGTHEDQTSPLLVIAGHPGCPGIAHHFLAGSKQSSGQFAPWLKIFFSAPGHVNRTSHVSLTERQSSWPIPRMDLNDQE